MTGLEIGHGEESDHQSDDDTERDFHGAKPSVDCVLREGLRHRHALVNLRGLGERFLELLHGEAGIAGDAEDRLFAALA